MPIFKSKYPDIVVPNVTIPQLVFGNWNVKNIDKIAYIDGFNPDNKLSFLEVQLLANKVAKGLHLRGLREGDIVNIVSPNSIIYASLFHGILLAGGIVSTANPQATIEELGKQYADSKPKFIITIPGLFEKVKQSAGLAGYGWTILQVNTEDFKDLITNDGVPPIVKVSPNDTALLPYSSGTTGLPKGVMLSHRAVVAAVLQTKAVSPLSVDFNSVSSAYLPLCHIFGLFASLLASLYPLLFI